MNGNLPLGAKVRAITPADSAPAFRYSRRTMEWTDQGIVLSARRHGESSVILSLLTAGHGRHAGLVRGGAGRRRRGQLQPGNLLTATWRARLEDHLGSFTVELLRNPSASWLDDAARLAALSSACAIADQTLPEREPDDGIFESMMHLFAAMADTGDKTDWAAVYVEWELALLGALGFGLDLSACAATGANDGLAYVSPRSGRAVSVSAGEPYREKLLPLPGFLIGAADAGPGDVATGLALTGFFLDRHIFAPNQRRLPDARTRLLDRIRRADAAA
jgi:DNA repair protein RecO (recombination protein O)